MTHVELIEEIADGGLIAGKVFGSLRGSHYSILTYKNEKRTTEADLFLFEGR